jgi:hypothetical protein
MVPLLQHYKNFSPWQLLWNLVCILFNFVSFYLEQCEMMQERKKKPIKEFERWKTKKRKKDMLINKISFINKESLVLASCSNSWTIHTQNHSCPIFLLGVFQDFSSFFVFTWVSYKILTFLDFGILCEGKLKQDLHLTKRNAWFLAQLPLEP